MATVFHGYCKFLQQKTNGMSKQLPNKSNKTQWVCPKMGHKIHRNHHYYYVIFPLHFSKRYAPFWDTPELSALKLCQTFCTTEGAGLHHLVAMCSMCVHATKNKTCINSINMCNAMQRQGSIEICFQHWIFVVCIEKHWVSVSSLFSTSLGSRMVEKDVCGQNWAVRTRNAERNNQKTYIASASSTSAKRSWGPCWKFHIALWCLKLQETELHVCVSLRLDPFNPLQGGKVRLLTMRLKWEAWLETMMVAQIHHVGCKKRSWKLCFTGIRSVQSVHDPVIRRQNLLTDHQLQSIHINRASDFANLPQHQRLPAVCRPNAQRQALRSQVDGMAMWHAVKRCI